MKRGGNTYGNRTIAEQERHRLRMKMRPRCPLFSIRRPVCCPRLQSQAGMQLWQLSQKPNMQVFLSFRLLLCVCMAGEASAVWQKPLTRVPRDEQQGQPPVLRRKTSNSNREASTFHKSSPANTCRHKRGKGHGPAHIFSPHAIRGMGREKTWRMSVRVMPVGKRVFCWCTAHGTQKRQNPYGIEL